MRPGTNGREAGPDPLVWRRKKLRRRPEPPGYTRIEYMPRAKPPSPSPSISRRRTPAVLAAGVLLCEGRSRFIAHSGQVRRGKAEQKRASVVSGTLASCLWRLRVCGVGCADPSFGMAPDPSFLASSALEADRRQLPLRSERRRHHPAQECAVWIV